MARWAYGDFGPIPRQGWIINCHCSSIHLWGRFRRYFPNPIPVYYLYQSVSSELEPLLARWSWPQTGLTSLTPPCSDLVALTGFKTNQPQLEWFSFLNFFSETLLQFQSLQENWVPPSEWGRASRHSQDSLQKDEPDKVRHRCCALFLKLLKRQTISLWLICLEILRVNKRKMFWGANQDWYRFTSKRRPVQHLSGIANWK